jgi:hypothetical protein
MLTEDYADSDADLKLSEAQLFFRLTSQILNLDKNVVIAILLPVEKESASDCLRSKMCFPTVCFKKLETSLAPGSSYTFGFSSSVSCRAALIVAQSRSIGRCFCSALLRKICSAVLIPSIAAETSPLNSSALGNAPLILTTSISRAAASPLEQRC